MRNSIRTSYLLIVTTAIVFLGSGCMCGPSKYRPFKAVNGQGYMDNLVGENEYLVEFRGNVKTTVPMTKNYMLYRCAELACEKGFDHFIVLGMEESPFKPIYPKTKIPLPGYLAYIRVCKGQPVAVDSSKVYDARQLMAGIESQIRR